MASGRRHFDAPGYYGGPGYYGPGYYYGHGYYGSGYYDPGYDPGAAIAGSKPIPLAFSAIGAAVVELTAFARCCRRDLRR